MYLMFLWPVTKWTVVVFLVLIYRLGKGSPEGITASIGYLVSEGEMTAGCQGF